MTALHAYAAQLVAERRVLTLPVVEAGDGDERRVSTSARRVAFHSATLEYGFGDFRADVALWTEGRDYPLLVEIRVTHASERDGGDRGRIDAVRGLGMAMVEIDLGHLRRDHGPSAYDRAILHEAPRVWLRNARIDELNARIADERRRRDRRRRDEERRRAKALAERHEEARRRTMADDPAVDPRVVQVRTAGLGDLLEAPAPSAGLFLVHPERWRAFVLSDLLDETHPKAIGWIVTMLGLQDMLDVDLNGRVDRATGLVDGSGNAIRPLRRVLEDWFGVAERAGAVREAGGGWLRAPFLGRRLREIVEEERRTSLEAEARKRRIDRLRALLDDIAVALPKERLGPFVEDIDRWSGATFRASTPSRMAFDGGDDWELLERQLRLVAAFLRRPRGEAPAGLGLPHLEEAFGEAVERQAERDRIERLRREEAERTKAAERVAELRSAAYQALGLEATSWLQAVHAELRATPEAAAADDR